MGFQQRQGVVRRSVVTDEHFEIREGLGQDTVHGFADEPGRVISGYVDGNLGHGIDFAVVVLPLLTQRIGLDQVRQADGEALSAVHLAFSQFGQRRTQKHSHSSPRTHIGNTN